jgi:signal peptidase I
MISKPKKKKKKNRPVSKAREIFKAITLVLIIGAALRAFVIQPFRAPDSAMQNALYNGDFLLVSKLSYMNEKPKQGDLIVFTHPLRNSQKLVRRIVAIEGETVEVSGKKVYVNGAPLQDFETTLHSDYRILPVEFSGRDYMASLQVPSGSVFVLGDNRDKAEDSRSFGCVPVGSIDGKGLFVYFSWTPDPNAPKLKPPYIIPAIELFFYNIYNFPSRVRWDRLFI